MRVGILGAGAVGKRLAALFEAGGHEVMVGSRTGEIGLAAAADHGEVVVLATPFTAAAAVLAAVASQISGKILVDATNPLDDNWGPLALGEDTSAAETIAGVAGDSRVVKCFNTIFADAMTPERIDRGGARITAFVASDDAEARKTVASLAADAGFDPLPLNRLAMARYLEAMAHLNIEIAVAQGGGTDAAFLYHRRPA